MPWTAKQLKLFRAAAHNPAIAKSSGIKQADAERMSKEGLKKATGGLAKIGKQDTRHGKTDLPFHKLNRFAGMNAGGNVKESKAMVKKEVAFMKKKGAPASMIKHEAAEMGAMKKGGFMRPKKDIAADQMAMAPYKKGGTMRYAEGGGASIMDTIEKYNKGAKETIAEGEKNTRDAGAAAVDAFNKGKHGAALKEGVKGLGSAAKTLAVDVPVEAFRAGMNRLAYGKKMARGGGIESKGKTKGTMIKMAGGGYVKAADGCATKGKTKGKMV
jgi:hypothetical protein